MDEKLFLQKLSEVAEWHRPQTGPNGACSINKRAKSAPEHPGPITQEELDEMSDAEAQDYYDRLMAYKASLPNDSVGPEIKRLKIQPVNCEDCGNTCANGRKLESKLHQTGKPHWRTRCVECNLYKDPVTGKFTINPQSVHSYMGSYYRPKLGIYKSKFQSEIKKPEPQIKERLKEIVQVPKEEFRMVPYDKGDSIVYVREPISKD